MKIKVSEASNLQLDYMVITCIFPRAFEGKPSIISIVKNNPYCTSWKLTGPIIDKMDGYQMKVWLESSPSGKCEAHIHNYEGNWIAFGPTQLVAALRCFIMSRLGDEVEVPEELK
jgi:hypothetical protein